MADKQYPHYLQIHDLYMIQVAAERQRVGWRHEIEEGLRVRLKAWRDVGYERFYGKAAPPHRDRQLSMFR